jgi:WD repeat-containing protein 59
MPHLSDPSKSQSREESVASKPYQSPSLISDAMRRLSLAAADRSSSSSLQVVQPRKMVQDEQVLRIMTNFLTFAEGRQQRAGKEGSGIAAGAGLEGRSQMAWRNAVAAPTHSRRSTAVFIKRPAPQIPGPDKDVARVYEFQVKDGDLGELCRINALWAMRCGREDHARVFGSLAALFPPPVVRVDKKDGIMGLGVMKMSAGSLKLIKSLVENL